MAKTKTKKAVKKRPAKARVSNEAKAKKFREAAAKRRAKVTPKRPLKAAKKAAPEVKVKSGKKVLDQNAKAEQLMARGRERGFITYDEILKSFPNIETDVDFLEQLYDRFQTAHIDVLEGG